MSSFLSGRFTVYKNTTNNKLKKKTFSSLKNSVHVEPVWFSLDNLTLCAALTTAQILYAIKFEMRCPQIERQAVNKTKKFR